MTFDDAVAALEGAVAEENGQAPEPSLFTPAPEAPLEQAPAESAPQGENAPSGAAPVVPEAPVAPAAPAAPVVDTFDDGKFNPDTLPEELKPAWAQLQATFTRKTQDVAEQRRQLESFGDINQLTEAVQLHQQLQDPANWPRFQAEIAQLMEARGIQAPVQHPANPTPPVPTGDAYLDSLAADPELAPLAETIRTQRAELAQLQQHVMEREQQQAVEQRQMAAIGEFQRQEGILRSDGLTDEDMNQVYQLAHAHNGNLLAANEAYQGLRTSVLSAYLARKTAEQQTAGATAPISGAGGTSTVPTEKPRNLEHATEIAMETLRAAGMDTLDL